MATLVSVSFDRVFVAGPLAGLTIADSIKRLPASIAAATVRTMIENVDRVQTPRFGASSFRIENPKVVA